MKELLQKYNIEDKIIAAGVSGGADSLALVLMANEQLAPLGKKIIALTVDHGLRPSSADEAAYVAQIMAQHNIEHHILHWEGKKPTTGIEEAAREARFALMSNWCQENDVRCLMLAHHSQDQAETFLMRLQRGSGLQGLCAIREIAERRGLLILRPLLKMPPQELQNYLQARNIRWIEDESNEDDRFLRNKIRHFLPVLEQNIGISVADICHTAERLQSADDYIQSQVSHFFATQVQSEYSADITCFDFDAYKSLHKELQFRILGALLEKIYIPRAENVLRLQQRLMEDSFKCATLGKKEILLYEGKIWLIPELAVKQKTYRAEWKEFTTQNPQYKKQKLPPKVKFAIIHAWRKNDI
ncbi:MAG: tRNA lysidine(34) synthetase TilS [Alphaproteobacteria bacterium]|nr:tRNA lysidine(34) synthetase TilS [Alphaproteobacteria bacterium]